MSANENEGMEVLSTARFKSKKTQLEIVDLVDEDNNTHADFQQFKFTEEENVDATLPKIQISGKAEKENKRQPTTIVPMVDGSSSRKKTSTSSVKANNTNNSTTKPKTSRVPAKTKIEKEFEKLSQNEKEEFLSKIQSLYKPPNGGPVPTGVPLAGDSNRLVADITSLPSVSSLPEEKEMMKLRLELGDVLNKQADLKAKEKKLRLSIKKIQRKITSATERVLYDIQCEHVEDILSSLFPSSRSNNPAAQQQLQEKAPSFFTCPLWIMAQQSEQMDPLCEQKRICPERDAILTAIQNPSPAEIAPSNISFSSQTISNEANEGESSFFSQVISAMDSTHNVKQVVTVPHNLFLSENDKIDSLSEFANRWIDVVLHEDLSGCDNTENATKFQDIIHSVVEECPVKKELMEMTIRAINSKSNQFMKFSQDVLSWVSKLGIILYEMTFRKGSIDRDVTITAVLMMWFLFKGLVDGDGVSNQCPLEAQYPSHDGTKRSSDALVEDASTPSIDASSKRPRTGDLLIDLTSPFHQAHDHEMGCIPFDYDVEDVEDTTEGSLVEVIRNDCKVNNAPALIGSSTNPQLEKVEEGIFAKFQRLAAVSETPLSSGLEISSAQIHTTVGRLGLPAPVTKITENNEVDREVVKKFLRLNLDLYQDILMYVPLNLDEVHRRMNEAGHRVAKEKLKSILDSLCVYQTVGYKR